MNAATATQTRSSRAVAADVFDTMARCIIPRPHLAISDWAEKNRVLSSKESPEEGAWRNSRNPLLVEPMDCMSARSTVTDVALMFPIQFGKTMIASNVLGAMMDRDPGPIMVALPGEVSMNKWVQQKLNPLLENTPAVQAALTSTASRDSANQRTFKDFAGGQLYIEHAGSPQRLKSTSVRTMIVDEVDAFATELREDDPMALLEGRTSAYVTTGKRLYISTPDTKGISRIEALWEQSDQRRWHVPCPDCGHRQPLEWSGLVYSDDAQQVWYACRNCGSPIDEAHKTAMIAAGRWVPAKPGARIRGYHANCLYYPIGLGPRWAELVRMWRAAQGDRAALKTFINDRLAEPWEDPAMRAHQMDEIRDRASGYKLRTAPDGVLAITAGVDTQDDRLEVQIVGWGRNLRAWTLDYAVLDGDPAADDVWVLLTQLLNRPIQHERGGLMRVEATAIDAGGHRTESVKTYVRRRLIHRPMAIFGARNNNAPVLSRGKLEDTTRRDKTDKRGLRTYQVGTVQIKHDLFAQLTSDADREPHERHINYPDELPEQYYAGLVSQVYNPHRNRFEKRRGAARDEPLDTWVYAYAATHHASLRLHRYRDADWDQRAARLAIPQDESPAAVDADAARVTPITTAQQATSAATTFATRTRGRRVRSRGY